MVEDQKGKMFYCSGDVSSFEDSERMVKDIIEEFNHIDILVNNAGITKRYASYENEKKRILKVLLV